MLAGSADPADPAGAVGAVGAADWRPPMRTIQCVGASLVLALLLLACGPADSPAPDQAVSEAAPAPAAPPPIRLEILRDTRMAEAFYPVPLEVSTTPGPNRSD
jgi:hypothetical protein